MAGIKNTPTEITVRLVLPELMERGVPNTLRCPLYQSGALLAPSAGTVSIIDPSNVSQVSGASVSVVDSVATYSYTPSASLPYGDGWRVEWTLTVSGEIITARNTASLVRCRLRNPVCDQDLYGRVSGLDPAGTKPIHSLSSLQEFLDSSWQEIQRKLINKGNRPNLVMEPSALFDVSLNLAMAHIFDDFKTRLNPAYAATAAEWRGQFKEAWGELHFLYDAGDRGQADEDRRPANPVTFLASGGNPWGGGGWR